jgi:hypothetical protein
LVWEVRQQNRVESDSGTIWRTCCPKSTRAGRLVPPKNASRGAAVSCMGRPVSAGRSGLGNQLCTYLPSASADRAPSGQDDGPTGNLLDRRHHRRADLVVVHGGVAPRAEPVPAPRPPRVAVTGVRASRRPHHSFPVYDPRVSENRSQAFIIFGHQNPLGAILSASRQRRHTFPRYRRSRRSTE